LRIQLRDVFEDTKSRKKDIYRLKGVRAIIKIEYSISTEAIIQRLCLEGEKWKKCVKIRGRAS